VDFELGETEKGFVMGSESASTLREDNLSSPVSKNGIAKVVAAIPAYNEERSIAKVVLLAQRYVDKVVVCDDGSTDATAMIAERLGAIVVRHPLNKGKGEALATAFKETLKLSPDVVVMLDADGQHDPEEIPRLVEPIVMGKGDVVIGSRYVEGGHADPPIFRRFGLRIINFLCRKAVNAHVRDTQSGFRALSRKAFEVVSSCQEKGFGVDSEQLALAVKNGLQVVEVPVNIKYKGLEKASKRAPLRHGGQLIATILRLVTEERPLLYIGVPGAILTLIGLVLAVFLLWLFNVTRYFSLHIALIMFGTSLVGLLLMIAAVMLHGLRKMVDLINHGQET